MGDITIYLLLDNNGNNIAGLTPELAVYDQNGTRLPDKLDLLKLEIDSKADSISTITGSAGEVTQEIAPNKYYTFGECSTLTITFGAEIPNIYNEYMFLFSSGDTPTVLTLPETVKWIGDSLVDSNKTYLVSIVNNIAVMGGA